jgi:hypothetical protein
MNRLSAIDAIGPAFFRVGTMLFSPFRLRTWLKIGFIGCLGGGLVTASSGGGNMNFRGGFPPQFPKDKFPEGWDLSRVLSTIHLADYIHLIMIAIGVAIVFGLIFQYLFCRFRFILFDSIISGEAVIGRGWRNYASQANRYFGFWLVFRLVHWAVMMMIIGVPLWHAYKSGVFSGDNSLSAFFGVFASIALSALLATIVFAVISTLMKDFVMPVLALDDLPLGDAFSAVWRVVVSEPGAWAGYMGMKLLCSVGAAIALTVVLVVAMIPAIFIIGIPVGLVILVGVLVAKSLSVAVGVIICIAGALLAAAGFACVVMILGAPVVVFFASYAFYFFGGRYPKLAALLWPQASPPSPQSQMAGVQPAL